MDSNKKLEDKIEKLINSMELLIDAVGRGKGDNGYTSNSRFTRMVKNGGNSYIKREYEELTQDEMDEIHDSIVNSYRNTVHKINEDIKKIDKKLGSSNTSDEEKIELRFKRRELWKKRREANQSKKNVSEEQIRREYEEEIRPDSDKNLHKKWEGLSAKDKAIHGNDEEKFKSYERKLYNYHTESDERDELRRRLSNSGLGNTAFGRFGQNVFDRQQRAADLGNFANYLSSGGGAQKFAKALGGGKGMAKVTAGLGGFSKALGKASKLLGGPWVQAIMMAIDVLHGIGDAVAEWKKNNAKMIEFQTKYEELTYEHDKQIANLQAEQQVVDIEYEKDIQMKMMEVQGQNLMEAAGIQNKQLINSVNAAVGGMTQGIMQSAYQAGSNMVDYQADVLKSQRAREVRGVEQERYNALRKSEYSRDKELNKAEQRIVDVNYEIEAARNQLEKEHYIREKVAEAADITNGISVSSIAGGVSAAVNTGSTDTASFENGKIGWGESKNNVNPVTGQAIGEVGRFNNNNGWDTTKAAVTGLVMGSNMVKAKNLEENAQFDNAAKSLQRTADYQKQSIDNYYKVSLAEQKARAELLDKEAETVKDWYNMEVDTLSEMRKVWLNVAQEIETFWLEIDKSTNKASLNQGILEKGQRTQFQMYLNNVANTVGKAYGKSGAEIAEIQNNYSTATGRNKTMGAMDYEKQLYMGTRLGDESLVAEYGADMEIFNHGVETSVDLLDEALDNVNKVGLNGKKYAKDLVSNLKLAQKYNFKGGTKELMEMAKWAQQTRFNLSSLSGIIEKAQEGGIEGIITQSAGFQVLGGHAAINSDPLGMLYDAWADPQNYAKRMQDMTKGFGRFNAKTGETMFNINESMQIAQMAKLQGRSAEELRGEIMQRNKASQVEKQLNSYQQFNDEQKTTISNKAEYKNGRWVVKMNNGDENDVSRLTTDDLKNLMPKGHEERMESLQEQGVDYLRQIVDYQTKYKGEEILQKGTEAQALWGDFQKAVEERIQQMHESFVTNFQTNTKNISTAIGEATNAQKDLITLYKDNAEAMAKKQNDIAVSAGEFQTSLDKLTEVISNAVSSISKSTVITHQEAPTPTKKVPETKEVKNNSTEVKENPYSNIDWLKPGMSSQDAISFGNGKPMAIAADMVTPVHDGTARIAKTDPNDTAIFAKDGGPFDKLFDGIFGKVSTIYNEVSTNKSNIKSAVLNTVSKIYEASPLSVFGGSSDDNSPSNINLTINGKLELSGQNGQSIDIINELKNNPMFIRQITEMIVLQMNNNAHGGRNEMFHNRFSR